MFLNALAWTTIGLFVFWLITCIVTLAKYERHPAAALLIQQAIGRRAPWMFGAMIVSVLWLVFGA